MIMLAWPILALTVPALTLDIAVDHKPRCVIAVPNDASSHEQVAAEELQRFVWASTRAKLKIVAEGGVKGAAIFVRLTDAKLGRAGYVQKLTDDVPILVGKEDPVTGNDIWATRNRMTTDRRGSILTTSATSSSPASTTTSTPSTSRCGAAAVTALRMTRRTTGSPAPATRGSCGSTWRRRGGSSTGTRPVWRSRQGSPTARAGASASSAGRWIGVRRSAGGWSCRIATTLS